MCVCIYIYIYVFERFEQMFAWLNEIFARFERLLERKTNVRMFERSNTCLHGLLSGWLAALADFAGGLADWLAGWLAGPLSGSPARLASWLARYFWAVCEFIFFGKHHNFSISRPTQIRCTPIRYTPLCLFWSLLRPHHLLEEDAGSHGRGLGGHGPLGGTTCLTLLV